MDNLFKKHCKAIIEGSAENIPRFNIYLDSDSYHELLDDFSKIYPKNISMTDLYNKCTIEGNRVFRVHTYDGERHFNIVRVDREV